MFFNFAVGSEYQTSHAGMSYLDFWGLKWLCNQRPKQLLPCE